MAFYGTFSAGKRFSFVTLNGKLRLETGGTGNGVTSQAIVLDNTWHHVAVTVASVTSTTALVTLYVDGVSSGAGTFAVNTTVGTSGMELIIASRSPTAVYGFSGSIDYVRVWDVVRTGAEILGSMNNELCTFPAGLLTYLKLNDGIAGANNGSVISLLDEVNPSITNIYPQNFIMNGSLTNFVSGNVGIDKSINLTSTALVSNENNGNSYQWVMLVGGESIVIPGATGITYTPTATGSYAVQITKGECTETSEEVSFNTLNTKNNWFENQVTVSPNPTNSFFRVNLPNTYEEVTVRLISVTGSVVLEKIMHNASSFQMNISQPAGLYFLNISTESGNSAVIKVVKN